MVESKELQPPRWATRFLNWYCRPEMLEDLQGDLNEYFERNVNAKGLRRARMIYIIDVLKFFRSYTIRKPKFVNLLIQWIMIGSYIKTSSRSIFRNRFFSAINSMGLAISMTVGLLMITFLNDLTSYDQFHEKKDRIYHVYNHYKTSTWDSDVATTSIKASRQIKESIPGIEDVVVIGREVTIDVTYDDKVIPIQGFSTDKSFFNVFSFRLKKGNASTALKDPFTVVLTESSAKKIFGDEDPIGKAIKSEYGDFAVTGVLTDVPVFSQMKFDMLISYATVQATRKNPDVANHWEEIWSTYVYVLLEENSNPETVQKNLDKLSDSENALLTNTMVNLHMQKITDVVLGKDMTNSVGPVMPSMVVWVVVGLAIVVILSACFNYTNLSIARSLRRSREVGIRKIAGARKSHVLGQFLVEAVLISFLALSIALLMFFVLKPQFLSIAPEIARMVTLELSGKTILYFVALAIVTGVVAGFLPALFFSRINALHVLKDASMIKVFRHVTLRKALIFVQYTFSIMLIAVTIVGYKQYSSFINLDLGYKTDNIVNIDLQGNKADLLLKDLKELPEVEQISRSIMVTSIGSFYGGQMKYHNLQDSSRTWFNSVDENYFPLHGHKFLAGKNFTPKPSGEETEVIVNEQVIKRFNISPNDPQEAIGETIEVDGKKLQIVGVLKDFHYGTAQNAYDLVVFRYLTEEAGGFINAKIVTDDWPLLLSTLEHKWKKIDPVHPFKARFYSEQIEEAYTEIFAILKIIGFLSFLAICISSLGLLGMVVFTTETKLKEISIRKVLGASDGSIIVMLSRGFFILLAIAAVVSLPITFFLFENIFLTGIAFRAPITIMDLLYGVFVVGGIAFVLITLQTWKVTKTNPAEVLKNE
jgi:putative ABC transport system permease protein